MKKNLLITMGCSMTEGVGCYDYSLIDEEKEYQYRDIGPEHYPRFHEFGWPNRVGRKLGFDKVINLGYGGSSNSAHIKIFLGTIPPIINELKKEYQLYLIWMMTDPTRMSYAKTDGWLNMNPKFMRFDLETAFMNDMMKFNLVPEKEQAFIMSYSEHVFHSLGIRFLFTSWLDGFEEMYKYFDSDNYLSPFPHRIANIADPAYRSKICRHPNELGYEYMANSIVEKIDMFRHGFRKGPYKEDIEWEHMSYEPIFDTPLQSFFK